MNKLEFIEALEAKMEAMGNPIESHAQAERITNAMIDVITDTVADGEKVALTGFGSFYPYDMKARKGRNVATGESIDIPAKRVPKFKAGTHFKKAVLKD